jgi:hypothetical protein
LDARPANRDDYEASNIVEHYKEVAMKVYLKPKDGTPKSNLHMAATIMERIIGFRGRVRQVKAEKNRLVVDIEINPQWDLPEGEKVLALTMWIKTKVRAAFEVLSIK